MLLSSRRQKQQELQAQQQNQQRAREPQQMVSNSDKLKQFALARQEGKQSLNKKFSSHPPKNSHQLFQPFRNNSQHRRRAGAEEEEEEEDDDYDENDDDDDDEEDEDEEFSSSNEQYKWRKTAHMLPEGHNFMHTSNNDLLINNQAENGAEEDNSSSISFAQSGCHSILSAWRFKANNKFKKLNSKKQTSKTKLIPRPQSVLSNVSNSTNLTKKSTFSLAKSNRIPLGFPASQRQQLQQQPQVYFVTNSQRRRRANELLLNTLEARRRALSMQRNASLYGSNSYLDVEVNLENSSLGRNDSKQYLSNRSLSPGSPIAALTGQQRLVRSPTMATQQRQALSDLGLTNETGPQTIVSRSPTRRLMGRNDLKPNNGQSPISASLVQKKPISASSRSATPLSESGEETDNSTESSGSQFTQLVTSELTPHCLDLLNDFNPPASELNSIPQRRQAERGQPQKSAKVGKRKQKPSTNGTQFAEEGGRQRCDEEESRWNQSADKESDLGNSSKLRRDALRRDSIRRLRLNNKPAQEQPTGQRQQRVNEADELSSSSASERQRQLKALPKARKLDIENNPFLNRGHFRSSTSSSTIRVIPGAEEEQQSNGQRPVEKSKPKILTPKPRMFSEAAREREKASASVSSGMDCADSSRKSSESKQHVAGSEQSDDVQLVERMLRQMKPNQVFTSYSRQQKTEAATTTTSSKIERISALQENMQSNSQINFANNTNSTQSKSVPQVPRQQFKSIGKKVESDIQANARPSLQARPRASQRAAEAGDDELLLNQPSASISPPLGFGDSNQIRQGSPQVSPSPNYYLNREPKTRLVIVEPRVSRSMTSIKKIEISKQQQPVKPAPRSLSVERPTVVAAPSRKPPTDGIGNRDNDRLPTFERTADDEFRKRVDYLRRLAKANLKPNSEQELATPAAGRSSNSKQPSTRPMSTNWASSSMRINDRKPIIATIPAASSRQIQGKQPNEASQSLFDDERARWRTGPYKDENRPSSPRRSPATTNLDAILADKYQLNRSQPVVLNSGPAGQQGVWRRSNSSLASVSTSNGRAQTAIAQTNPIESGKSMRPQSPQMIGATSAASHMVSNNHQTPMGALSQPVPRQQNDFPSSCTSDQSQPLTSSALVKLVVKEKSAPKLNYAFVEQQQPNSSVKSAPTPAQRPQLLMRQVEQGAVTKNMKRAASSPKSPDFDTMASSSNDDSAIASSVSSPSLSFMMNQQQQPSTSAIASSSQQQQLKINTSQIQQKPIQLLNIKPKLIENASGTLQSILRKAQQQQFNQQQQQQQQQQEQQQQLNLGESSSMDPFNKNQPSFNYQKYPNKSSIESDNNQQSMNSAELEQGSSRQMPQTMIASTVLPYKQFPANTEQQQSPPKRVHFNDRTSIRSFESISSLVSNSTAIHANELHYMPRDHHNVSSPDSMGDGESSDAGGRLSADSPLKNLGGFTGVSAGGGSLDNGAAIYAIRGDPELEFCDQQQNSAASNLINAIGLHTTAQLTRNPYGLQQQQLYHHAPTPERREPIPTGVSPFIRMTAPPTISSTPKANNQQKQAQFGLSPRAGYNFNYNQTIQSNEDPDEDTDYALRLRQAATQQVYQFTQQQQPQLVSPQLLGQRQFVQPMPMQRPLISGSGMMATQSSPTGAQPARTQQQQQRPPNYQTEV